MRLPLLAALLCLAPVTGRAAAQPAPSRFSFRELLTRTPPSLQVQPPRVDGARVRVEGGDSRRPQTPFTFEWGDGTRTESFFAAEHTYADTTRNYTVTVTAHYPNGEQSRRSVVVAFVRPSYTFVRDPRIPRRVRVAAEPVVLGTTVPGMRPPADLGGFADSDLAIPRATLEYVLDVGHYLQMDFCSDDIDSAGGIEQVVLCQPSFGGASSLWYTKPVAIGANPAYLSNLSGVSSLFHEMGHNLTLNSPARCRFGGKTDGPMNTIVSETLAQVMQHATAWEILNDRAHYGLSADLAEAIAGSAHGSFGVTARCYRDYLAQGCPFATRQEQDSKADRTLGTFMALAYVFVEQAEEQKQFRTPLKRMMRLLQTFGEPDRVRYQRPDADAFRATFMVAAISYGFDRDLRPRFRELKLEIDDAVYAELLSRMRARASAPQPIRSSTRGFYTVTAASLGSIVFGTQYAMSTSTDRPRPACAAATAPALCLYA